MQQRKDYYNRSTIAEVIIKRQRRCFDSQRKGVRVKRLFTQELTVHATNGVEIGTYYCDLLLSLTTLLAPLISCVSYVRACVKLVYTVFQRSGTPVLT